jgi:tetratricopeptide (TPR) repeat protein
MENKNINQYPVSEVEYDLATLELKGRRFKQAGDQFMELVLKTQSTEAWCGLGLSRLGLILEDTTLEEVFFCFNKAKAAGPDKTAEIEYLVLQTSTEAIGHLYQLYVDAIFRSRAANFRRTMAMVTTAASGIMAVNAANSNRIMGSIAYAGLTALSYDRYLDATASSEQLVALSNRAVKIIEELKAQVQVFITSDNKQLIEFVVCTKEKEKWVVETLKTDAQRAEEQNVIRIKKETEENQRLLEQKQKLLAQKRAEISDNSEHPFHSAKSEGIRLFKANKYSKALPLINQALLIYEADADLSEVQFQIRSRFIRIDVIVCIIPWFILSLMIGLGLQLGIGLAFILVTLVFGILLYYRDKKRQSRVINLDYFGHPIS